MRSSTSSTNSAFSSNMASAAIVRVTDGEGVTSLPCITEVMSQQNISTGGSPPGSRNTAGDILGQQGRKSPTQGHGCSVLRQQNNQLNLSCVEEMPDDNSQRKSHGEVYDLESVWLDQQHLYQPDSISVKSLTGLGLGGCGGRQITGLAPRSKSQPSALLSRKCGVKRRREERADERPTLDFSKMMQTAYKENEVERTRQKSRGGNLPPSPASAQIDLLAMSPNPLNNLSSLRKSLPSPSFNFAVTSGRDMSAFNFTTASVSLSPPPSPFIPVSRPGLKTGLASSVTLRPANQRRCTSQAPPTSSSSQADCTELALPYSPFIPVSQSSVQLQIDDTDDVIGGEDSCSRACCATDCSSDDELAQYMTHNNNSSNNIDDDVQDDEENDDDDDDDDADDDDSHDMEQREAEPLNVKQLDIDLEMIENN